MLSLSLPPLSPHPFNHRSANILQPYGVTAMMITCVHICSTTTRLPGIYSDAQQRVPLSLQRTLAG